MLILCFLTQIPVLIIVHNYGFGISLTRIALHACKNRYATLHAANMILFFPLPTSMSLRMAMVLQKSRVSLKVVIFQMLD